MAKINFSGAIQPIVSGQKANVMNGEARLIANSTSGKFQLTPAATKALGISRGEHVKFFDNRSSIEEAINNMNLEWIDPEKPVTSLVSELGDSSVNFKLLVWTDALKRGVVVSEVLNTIYDTLNQNNIEIPFPQQDVHIKN